VTAPPPSPSDQSRDREGATTPKVERLRTWLRRNIAAIVLMLGVTAPWAFLLGNARRPYFGTRLTSINNRPPTDFEQWLHFGEEWAINACIALFVLIALTACARWRLRAAVYLASLLTVGTASAWLMNRLARDAMSAPGTYYFDWESLSPLVGVAAASLVLLAASAWLEYYFISVRIIRRGDAGRTLCPVCRFDLAGSTGGQCPECGWTVPSALRLTTPPAAGPSPAAGPGTSTP
jgi:hypothetical protein